MFVSIVISALLCQTLVQAIPSIYFLYPKNITATCSRSYSWSKWFNLYKPKNNQDFDQEYLSMIHAGYGKHVCDLPIGIQARTVDPIQTDINYAVSWKMLNGIISALVSRTAGVDFEVRFCCADSDFITTTTTTPRPTMSNTCGRAQIKPSLQYQRIYGGSNAVPHSWPWQILYEEETHCETNKTCLETCGGTLLNRYHILTAAHCIRTKDPKSILISAGVHNRKLDQSNTRQERYVDRIFLHPDWNNDTLANDIAILRLSKPVDLNEYVQPACLPGPDPRPGSDVVLIGWGADRIGGIPSDQLRQVEVNVIDACYRFWSPFDENNQICVGQPVSGDSACQGDSGGPILQQYNGQWIVQGIASYVDDCKTNANYAPNIYTRVSAYLTWIESII